jgi:hypothetical protein
MTLSKKSYPLITVAPRVLKTKGGGNAQSSRQISASKGPRLVKAISSSLPTACDPKRTLIDPQIGIFYHLAVRKIDIRK